VKPAGLQQTGVDLQPHSIFNTSDTFGGRRAYVLLSYGSDASQHCATIAAALACRDVATERYDVIIFRIGTLLSERDLPKGVTQKLVDFPATKEGNGAGARFGKLWVSELHEYDSVAFIDHDVLVRKPLWRTCVGRKGFRV